MDDDNNMGKLSVSLHKDDEEKLRRIAKKRCRTISGQITFWIQNEKEKP